MKSFPFKFERELNFEFEGQRSVGMLRVGGIELANTNDAEAFWVCFWSLDQIHPSKGKIYGVDPLDALINCIEFLRTLIERHKQAGYRVWWNAEDDEAGLIPAK